MRFKSLFLVFLVLFLLLLAGCGAECKKDSDCVKPHFTGKCVSRECQFAPVPNEIGNGVCEPGENKCNAPFDCGICQGTNGPYLKYQCIEGSCVDAVPLEQIKPMYLSADAKVSGISVKVTSDFNQPFNLKRDLFRVKFSLMTLPNTVEDVEIKRIEITGIAPDKRKVSLYDEVVNRPLHLELDAAADLVLKLNSADNYGELSNIILNLYFDYYVVSSGKRILKSGMFPVRYSGLTKFLWVLPVSVYSCPLSCDDNNQGTEDVCSAETDFFCAHRPVSGVCGNFVCESGENRCSCAFDCGACSGAAGNYMVYACVENDCVAQLRPSFVQEKKSIFDDRDLSYFHLQNNFEFYDPFKVGIDSIALTFSLYEKKEEVSQVRITDIRLFDGSVEVARAAADLSLSGIGDSVSVGVGISEISGVEENKALNLAVWYEFDRGGQTAKNEFRKPLGRITLVKPGS